MQFTDSFCKNIYTHLYLLILVKPLEKLIGNKLYIFNINT